MNLYFAWTFAKVANHCNIKVISTIFFLIILSAEHYTVEECKLSVYELYLVLNYDRISIPQTCCSIYIRFGRLVTKKSPNS